jgi:hypothetical protein
MQTGRHDAPTEAGADPGLSLEEPPPPRRRSTGIGGRNHRNGWPASAGISGRDGPESVAGFRRRIQPRSVSAEQPIFCATDWIAAHSDSYSCACSPTSRTARSRTSAEYCFALAMAPISQGLEPPANSGRFSQGIEYRIVVVRWCEF